MAKFSLFMRQFLMFSALVAGVFLSSCKDEEVTPPSTIAFGSSGAAIAENSGAQTVTVSLSSFAPEGGVVTVTVQNGANTTDANYTTTPAAVNGNITLNVGLGEAATTFTVTPVDNDEVDGDKSITFTLGAATGGVALGTGTVSYTLTIQDDEVPKSYMSLADVRALFNGSDEYTFTEETLIKATIISDTLNVQRQNMIIQDETAGIAARFISTDEARLNTAKAGMEVEIALNSTNTVSAFRNLVQIGNLTAGQITLLDAAKGLPTAQKITVAQLLTGNYQSQLVEIDNVSFPSADGVETVNGTTMFSDGTNMAAMRVEGYAPFNENILPLGTGTLRGAGDIFNDDIQLRPLVETDIFEGSASATITASETELADFGQVNTNEMSAGVSYMVSATGMATGAMLMVTAPDGFMVSLTEDGTYAMSVEVAETAGEITDQMIWVKFAPTSGSSKMYSEAISHTTAGAVAVTVAVSGEEVAVTNVEPTPIADIRAMWDVDNDMTFETIVKIKGIVTSINDNVTGRNLYMQDASGAIVVRFNDNNTFVQGDEIEVNLNGATLGDFNNLVQLSGLELASAEKMGTAALPAYQKITVEQLNTGNFQAQLVEIDNATFAGADGAATVSGNEDFSDATGAAVMRTEGGASFAGNLVPFGTGTLRGLADVFGDTKQLRPLVAADIFESQVTTEITTSTATLASFGQVASGEMSTAASYTVSATGVATGNMLTVTAPAGFMVSTTENGTYASSVQVAENAGAITDQSIFVKLSHTSDLPANYAGIINHEVTGAVAVEVAVSGEGLKGANVLAYTSFEEPMTGDRYEDATADGGSFDHDLVNNDGQANVDFTSTGNEIGFDATFRTNGGVGITDGDNVGVTNFRPDGLNFPVGSQGYQLSDTDGIMVVTFDEVTLTGNVTFSMAHYVDKDGNWVNGDRLRVYLVVDAGEEIDILNQVEDAVVKGGDWATSTVDLSGKTTARLVIEVENNGGNDALFIDAVKFVTQ